MCFCLRYIKLRFYKYSIILYSTTFYSNSQFNYINLLSDNSGYYVISQKFSSTNPWIWKFLFSAPPSSEWQEISSIYYYAEGAIMLSDSQLFMFSKESSASNVHFYKITFGDTNVNWANQIIWVTEPCTLSYSKSLTSEDKSKIYSFFSFGTTAYLHFITFNATDGTVVGSRFKSSIVWSISLGVIAIDNFLVVNSFWNDLYNVIIINLSTYSFVIREFTGVGLIWGAANLASRR